MKIWYNIIYYGILPGIIPENNGIISNNGIFLSLYHTNPYYIKYRITMVYYLGSPKIW